MAVNAPASMVTDNTIGCLSGAVASTLYVPADILSNCAVPAGPVCFCNPSDSMLTVASGKGIK